MQLTDEQRQQVTQWISSGLKLSEIQDRMGTEFGLRMTYMDARLLVDDLKLTPQDPVADEPAKPAPAEEMPEAAGADNLDALPEGAEAPLGALSGKVSLSVDSVTRPGALVSGGATFSDGQTATWYLDQYGRFGLLPAQEGYRPSQPDVAELQALLDRELAKLGY